MGISFLGRLANLVNDPGDPSTGRHTPVVDSNGDIAMGFTPDGTAGGQIDKVVSYYTRPDGTQGIQGDGQAGDPKTALAGSPYSGESQLADPSASYGFDFLYGRDPNYASNKAQQEQNAGNQFYKDFTNVANQTLQTGQAANNADQFYGSQLWNRGTTSLYNSGQSTDQELALADQIGGAGGQSAADAQLQSGLNASEASNLALARSGRGWGQSGAALTQAVNANAAAGQNAANSAAQLRFQGQQAAAGLYGEASAQQQQAGLAQQQQGVSAAQAGYGAQLQSQQLGTQEYQTGVGEYFAGEDAQKAWIDAQHNADYQREALGMQQYGIQSGSNTAAAQLQEQQNARIGGYVGAGIGAIGAGLVTGGAGAPAGAAAGYEGGQQAGAQMSDTRAKKDQAKAEGVAETLASIGSGAQIGSAVGQGRSGDPIQQGLGLGSRLGRLAAGSAVRTLDYTDPDAKAERSPGHEQDWRDVYQRGVFEDAAPASFDHFAHYNIPRGQELTKALAAREAEPFDPQAPIDQSTVSHEALPLPYTDETTSSYDPTGSYDEPSVPTGPLSSGQFQDYLAQNYATSDSRAKKDAIYQQGVADTLRGIGSAPSVSAVDTDALDQAQRRQGGPVNDLRAAQGYSYRYKDPTMPGAAPGVQVGPMAQDLEHTAARGAVIDTPQGKMVDTRRLSLTNTAAIGEQQRALDDLEKQIAELKTAPVRASKGKSRSLATLPAPDQESEIVRAPFGADPDIDAAAVRDITFPGQARSQPIVYRGNGVYQAPLGADPDIDAAAMRDITFPADVVASDEKLKSFVDNHESHTKRIDDLERQIAELKGGSSSYLDRERAPTLTAEADARARGYAWDDEAGRFIPAGPPKARFADLPPAPVARFADVPSRSEFVAAYPARVTARGERPPPVVAASEGANREYDQLYGSRPQEIPMVVSSDDDGYRNYGGVDLDALDDAHRRAALADYYGAGY